MQTCTISMAETSGPKLSRDKYFKAQKAIFLVALKESGRKPVWSTPETLVLHLLWAFPVSHVIKSWPVSCLNQWQLPSIMWTPLYCRCAIIFSCSHKYVFKCNVASALMWKYSFSSLCCADNSVWRSLGPRCTTHRLEGHCSLLFLYSSPCKVVNYLAGFTVIKTVWILVGDTELSLCVFFFSSKVFKRSFNLDVSWTDHINNKYKLETMQLHQIRCFIQK